jgi:hypothetical protein
MKHFVLSLLLALPFTSPAQVAPARHRPTHHPAQATRPAAPATPKVYVCGGGSAYAYHNSDGCAGLSRCSHGVSAITVAEAEGMGRRPCKKCY